MSPAFVMTATMVMIWKIPSQEPMSCAAAGMGRRYSYEKRRNSYEYCSAMGNAIIRSYHLDSLPQSELDSEKVAHEAEESSARQRRNEHHSEPVLDRGIGIVVDIFDNRIVAREKENTTMENKKTFETKNRLRHEQHFFLGTREHVVPRSAGHFSPFIEVVLHVRHENIDDI